MIEIDGLEMRFGETRAVGDVTLSIAAGEMVTLLGPSGCGKTTLLKLISGFLTPTAGTIRLAGEDVTRLPPERRDTALCFQSYALFPHLTVAQNIAFGPRQLRIERAETARRLEALLAQVDLKTQRDRLPNALSGGQQQRVALARALAIQPSVVLFDEPLSNLDAKLRDQVRREIRTLQRSLGFTAIYVTHDQAEALAISDRIVVMRDGGVEQVGPPEVVYELPATAFVADFVGAANLLPLNADGSTELGKLVAKAAPTPGATHLIWRPEDARLAVPDDENAVAGTVADRAYQGAWTELHVDTPGAPRMRLHLAGAAPEIGAAVRYAVPPERLRYVGGAGQAALAAE